MHPSQGHSDSERIENTKIYTRSSQFLEVRLQLTLGEDHETPRLREKLPHVP